MDEIENRRLHAIVEGRVQGVNFRYFVTQTARRFGINGWVRNRWDGTVEVVAEGKSKNLESLIKELHRGPASANVTAVKYEWHDYAAEFKEFQVRMTR
ncbi:MAG: acylphosphatase [Anaerolineales bacterium]|jgi:acylphosphatase